MVGVAAGMTADKAGLQDRRHSRQRERRNRFAPLRGSTRSISAPRRARESGLFADGQEHNVTVQPATQATRMARSDG